ncbi:hypothetical protein QTN47_27355 [Danxiaibacter flavus]|uniref:DUF3168 domain-containing protein n=1 Tax=Danxiaibacter flavus TaxID=3049108 RepID=A0ABV3ZMZ5_9BACT|nr:hypothetical protein QNM32_27355 [Chitinophagaceae bacterium DXS]
MITTFDIVDIVWNQINNSELKTIITGDVYKEARPVNSNVEDIVINCLPVNNEQLQEAVANVNIHVPNLKIKVDNIQDSQPNLERLKDLTRIAVDLLSAWGEDYNYEVQQQVLFSEGDQHYLNIRIEFFHINYN